MTRSRSPIATGSRNLVGLALSGGGAKGAYQVGVVGCLAEHRIPVAAVAGASIGALNGGVISAAPDLSEASRRLTSIWRELASAQTAVESHEFPVALLSYLSFLVSAGERSRFLEIIRSLHNTRQGNDRSGPRALKVKPEAHAILRRLSIENSIVTDPRLDKLINCHIGAEELATGLPLYVSVFRSRGAILDAAWIIAGLVGLADTPTSEFLYVQSLPAGQRRNAILASAAIPLIFEAQQVGGEFYADGGIGGLLRLQGNTPIEPLVKLSKCRVVIVTHLTDGSLFDRYAYPDTVIIEIRPQSRIARAGGLRDTLELKSSHIASWIDQGYHDTRKQLASIRTALDVLHNARAARAQRDEALADLEGDEHKR